VSRIVDRKRFLRQFTRGVRGGFGVGRAAHLGGIRRWCALAVGMGSLAGGPAWGQVGEQTAAPAAPGAAVPGVDKSGFDLFHPTPANLMRPLAADRPDVTESPFTVDAGHVQVETSFVEYAVDRRTDSGDHEYSLDVLPTDVRIGLTNNSEAGVIFGPWSRDRVNPVGPSPTRSTQGFNDLTLRYEVNLLNNDAPAEGRYFAAALMPFVTLPTGGSLSSDHVQGGVVLPATWHIADGIDLGAELAPAAVWDPDHNREAFELTHTIETVLDLGGGLGGFVEYTGLLGSSGLPYQAYADTGLTLQVGPNVQLDVGVNVGLNKAAEDLRLFSGITVRF
jgi:hypothetical protein